jgi:hypothetical protein
MMAKVYLVSDGWYSDYHICGVYSTKALAEQARMLYVAGNDVEELELDALPEHPPGLLAYRVVMFRDGNVNKCERESVQGHDERWSPYGTQAGKGVVFRVWARDEEHAVKIANERRSGLIASGEWTENFNEWINRRHPKAGQ